MVESVKTNPESRVRRFYGYDSKKKLSHELADCSRNEQEPIRAPNVRDWHGALSAAVRALASDIAENRQRIERMQSLERKIASLEAKVAELCAARPIQATIASLAPEPYVLLKDIPAVVQATDDDYTATFFDANIGMSGDTQEESVENLKAIIVDTFESLEEEEAILGPWPTKQLAILREFIQRRS